MSVSDTVFLAPRRVCTVLFLAVVVCSLMGPTWVHINVKGETITSPEMVSTSYTTRTYYQTYTSLEWIARGDTDASLRWNRAGGYHVVLPLFPFDTVLSISATAGNLIGGTHEPFVIYIKDYDGNEVLRREGFTMNDRIVLKGGMRYTLYANCNSGTILEYALYREVTRTSTWTQTIAITMTSRTSPTTSITTTSTSFNQPLFAGNTVLIGVVALVIIGVVVGVFHLAKRKPKPKQTQLEKFARD